MNVLILTPDAVGSTLLQRMLTIYMQFHKFNRPVINLHELTNGLEKYYNPDFNCEVLGKPRGDWGYYQSLEEIVQILESVDHYKTSRLAHYHIRNRKDSINNQVPFYQYLNENFYIIACRRQNVFEHALSWAVNKVTGKLNVYSPQEKILSFLDLYKDGITIDPRSFVDSLESYQEYLDWVAQHFHVASYFDYETDVPSLEEYILNLPVFSGQPKRVSWEDTFGINFQDWNLCHYMTSDIGGAVLSRPKEFWEMVNDFGSAQLANMSFTDEHMRISYNSVADSSWPAISGISDFVQLPEHIQAECRQQHNIIVDPGSVTFANNLLSLLGTDRKNFLAQHISNYQQAKISIDRMQDLGIIINGPPIKKQTLAEKKHVIKNYNSLIDTYNQWIEKNPRVGSPVDVELLDNAAQKELNHWHLINANNQLSVDKTTG